MSKKVLIISTSLRNGANSEILAHEAERGAKDAGHQVEFVTLKDKNIGYCKGCMACQKLGHCVINDDANAITEKMKNSEVIIWVTPVYYYEMSGQMKTLIDRANSLYVTGYNFKDVYVITTSADGSDDVVQTVINGLNGWCACLPGTAIKGYVNGGGLEAPNDATKNQELLQKAYNLGKNI
ncbi:flavodoxin family protein [bacterium]|nr:flavodoxin family protein [bacterium]MBR1620360.1 flavodoxin family protein [bacterium]